MNDGVIKTAPKQNIKGSGGAASSYTSGGIKAFHKTVVDGVETWHTTALSAVKHYEEAGGELWTGTSPNDMKRVR